jgi:hypothetical protein
MKDIKSNQKKEDYEPVSKIAWLMLGALSFGGVAFYLCGITNYENDSSFFSFAPLDIANIALSSILGSLISFYYHTARHQRALSFFKAVVVLFLINVILIGIQGIQKKEIVIRFVHFRGQDAVFYGSYLIVLAVLIMAAWLLAPILIQKFRKKTGANKSVHTDAE